MEDDHVDDRLPVTLKTNRVDFWLLRTLRPIPGAIAGAALGFHLYFRQPGLNVDTFAPLFLASLWAFGGMLLGMLVTSIAGWAIQRCVSRLLLSNHPRLAAGATLLCITGLCLVSYAPLETSLVAALWPKEAQDSPRFTSPPLVPQCSQAPPSNPSARKSWEMECQ